MFMKNILPLVQSHLKGGMREASFARRIGDSLQSVIILLIETRCASGYYRASCGPVGKESPAQVETWV